LTTFLKKTLKKYKSVKKVTTWPEKT